MTVSIAITLINAKWTQLANCISEPPDIFITPGDQPEPKYPNSTALQICRSCIVRSECLSWAIKNREVGIWGGTSEYQRKMLTRPRIRESCPMCTSPLVIVQNRHEYCLACGVTWPVGIVEEASYVIPIPKNATLKPCTFRISPKNSTPIVYCRDWFNHEGPHLGYRSQVEYQILIRRFREYQREKFNNRRREREESIRSVKLDRLENM